MKIAINSFSSRKTHEDTYKNIYLRHPSSSTSTTPFATFQHTGSFVKAAATLLTASETVNIGISNEDTGKSLAYKTYLDPYYAVYVETFGSPCEIGIRASTYSNPGYSDITVQYDTMQEAYDVSQK